MFINKLFNQNSILESAMQATSFKNNVLLQNIANSDTPNYKRKTVNFESNLQTVIDQYKKTGVANPSLVTKNLKVSELNNKVTLDGNGVDIETEMIEFYKNSMKYDIITNSVLSNLGKIDNVISTFR